MVLKARQRLGKYRIDRVLAKGGFSEVYRAYDTIEGMPVALKIPIFSPDDREAQRNFRREVLVTARLHHENVLPIKNADQIGGRFVIVHPLGERSLDDRLRSRLSVQTALYFADQMLAGLAYAHRRKVMHCDVKPENFILFPDNVLKLGDFGIAKVAHRTMNASGSGTLGFVAPEQALGRPSFRSDVFSLGLVIFKMLTGRLPSWPYEWPFPGHDRLKRKVSPEVIAFLRRSLKVDHRKRYTDADRMRTAFRAIKQRTALESVAKRKKRSSQDTSGAWREVRRKNFQRRFRKSLKTSFACRRCEGPVSELMQACPWCGADRPRHDGETRFPAECTRCHRGMKLDWRYCPWCYGPGYEPLSDRIYADKRYEARCTNARCKRKQLMPFMCYCPWCRTKVRRNWKIGATSVPCRGCGWGVLKDYWDHCPWCGRGQNGR